MHQNLYLHIILMVAIWASSEVTRSNGQFVRNTGLASSSNPCSRSCGPNTSCRVADHGIAQAECRCLDGFVPDGNTIKGCKPQCIRDNDCPDDHRCQGRKCVRVCQSGVCALNAHCDAQNHRPFCKCPRGYQGLPQIHCTKHLLPTDQFPVHQPPIAQPPGIPQTNPCLPNPCGQNAECSAHGDQPVCTCPVGYEGDPLTKCIRGECVEANDCPGHLTCQKYRCIDPCNIPNICGHNAECQYINHQTRCSCGNRMVGDPLISCRPLEELCRPSPCGNNTNCKVQNNRAVCSCLDNYIGTPLVGCIPECVHDSECPSRMTCDYNKCVNPCINACGEGALCDVVQGRARCSCPPFYKGNPQIRCFPECTAHSDCPIYQACYQLECIDPCEGAIGPCGEGAECSTQNHQPICSCPEGYTGDPFQSCKLEDLCRGNPCGTGADCTPGFDRDDNNRPVCTCPRGFFGNPLTSCQRGECQQDNDCRESQACFNYNCQDPCYTDLGSVCGDNAECTVKNHQPICTCLPGYEGNPIQSCYQRNPYSCWT